MSGGLKLTFSRPIHNMGKKNQQTHLNHSYPGILGINNLSTQNQMPQNYQLMLSDQTNSSRSQKINNINSQPKKNVYFPLRSIDPYEILEAYRAGDFINSEIPKKKIKKISNPKNQLFQVSGSDKYCQNFQVKEGGRTRLYLTLGHDDFQSISQHTQMGNSPHKIHMLKKGKCQWCRLDLETLPDKYYPVGFPIKVTKKGKSYIFNTRGKHCSGECCLANIIYELSSMFSSYILEECITWLKVMFYLLYPNEDLKPALDWKLRQTNGGTLTDEEYYQSRHYYYLTSNVITLPTKQEYGYLEESIQLNNQV